MRIKQRKPLEVPMRNFGLCDALCVRKLPGLALEHWHITCFVAFSYPYKHLTYTAA